MRSRLNFGIVPEEVSLQSVYNNHTLSGYVRDTWAEEATVHFSGFAYRCL